MNKQIGFAKLFKSSIKQKDNQPDFVGTGNIDGDEIKLAAWVKQTKGGDAYISIKITEDIYTPTVTKNAADDLLDGFTPIKVVADDDLPF